MSNGARLTAVIVVVAVAAIGLYFAFMTPSKKDVSVQDPLAADGSIAVNANPGELSEFKPGDTGATMPPDAAFGTAGSGTPAGTTAGTASGTPTVSGTIPAGGGAGTAGTATGAVVAANGTTGTAGGVTPTGAGATGTSPVTLAPPPAPEPAAGADYVVQKGDTLEGIARAKLGDGQKWKSIVELNPGLKPESLKIGQTIKLPAGASAGSEVAAKPAAPAGTAAPAGANTYTVQKGDTLIAISRKFFGSDAEWKRILEANKSVLKGDAGNLQPGMKLTIPAKR
jgi:nucleoid-associated protein YgaU